MFVILFVVLSTILLVELPKRQDSIPEFNEEDFSTPECLHDECYRDTPSANELNDIFFSNH